MEIMFYKSFDAIKFDLSPLLQGSTGSNFLKEPETLLLLVLEVWDVNQSIGNRILRIFGEMKFYLAPFLQGQMRSSFLQGPKMGKVLP